MGMNKKNNYTDSDKKCKKCGNTLTEVSHREITQKQLRQPFYFKRWYKCPSCNWILSFEADKVWNTNEMAEYVKVIGETESLFKAALEKE